MKSKILIVDDKDEFRRLTKTILISKYDVESTNNGIAALSLLQNGYRPDLIISDIMMPGLGGSGLLEQLKSSGAFNEIPIIMLSSINDNKVKIRHLEMGAADYLEKPYNPAKLLAIIDNIIAKK